MFVYDLPKQALLMSPTPTRAQALVQDLPEQALQMPLPRGHMFAYDTPKQAPLMSPTHTYSSSLSGIPQTHTHSPLRHNPPLPTHTANTTLRGVWISHSLQLMAGRSSSHEKLPLRSFHSARNMNQ